MAPSHEIGEDSVRSRLNSSNEKVSPIVNEPIELKKQLGLLNGVAIIVGVVIGSGIFVSPLGVLKATSSTGLSLIIWVLCGLLSTCGALCYAELGTMIPKSGAEFAYLGESFGGLFAFLYLWVALLIIMPTGNAVLAMTFAEYLLQPFFVTCEPPKVAVRLIAASIILFLTFINCYNVKWAMKIQDSFAFSKLLALFIIIIAGIIYMALGEVKNFDNSFQDTSYSPSDIAMAFYSGMFSFSGWNSLNCVTEELKRPTKDLPRAILISLPLVTFVYLLANISYFAVLTKDEILSSTTVAGTFGDKTLGMMSWVIPVFVAMSCFGGLNGGIFSQSRLFFVGARQGHLPISVSMINIKYLTPAPSLIFLALVSLLYLFAGHVFFLINLTSFVEALFITLTIAALLYFRIKQPNRKRPIKVNTLFPVIFLVVGLILVTLPFFEEPSEAGYGLLITLSGIPVYFMFVYWKQKPRVIAGISAKVTESLQKLLICTFPELDSGDLELSEEKTLFSEISQTSHSA